MFEHLISFPLNLQFRIIVYEKEGKLKGFELQISI